MKAKNTRRKNKKKEHKTAREMRKKRKRRNQPDCPSWWQHKDHCYEHHVQQGLYHVWHEFWANPKCSPLDTKLLLLLDVFDLKMILFLFKSLITFPLLYYCIFNKPHQWRDRQDFPGKRKITENRKWKKLIKLINFFKKLTGWGWFQFYKSYNSEIKKLNRIKSK